MDLIERISAQFERHTRSTQQALDWLAAPLAGAIETITHCLLGNGKILACGAGHAAADARAFVLRLSGRFELPRPALAAILLASPAASGTDETSSTAERQLDALANPGDVLLLIHADQDPATLASLASVVSAAQAHDLRIVLLSGAHADSLAEQLGDGDIHLCVPSERDITAHEIHRLALHCLCDGIDCLLLGVEN